MQMDGNAEERKVTQVVKIEVKYGNLLAKAINARAIRSTHTYTIQTQTTEWMNEMRTRAIEPFFRRRKNRS